MLISNEETKLIICYIIHMSNKKFNFLKLDNHIYNTWQSQELSSYHWKSHTFKFEDKILIFNFSKT